MEWSEEIRRFFQPDGGLRDVYVVRATRDTWETLWRALPSWGHQMSFEIAGEPAPAPATAGEALDMQPNGCPLLRLDVDGIDVVTHFFWDGEIEFDIDPEAITDAGRFASLLGFVRRLGQVVRQDVIVTYENQKDDVILRYRPQPDEITGPETQSIEPRRSRVPDWLRWLRTVAARLEARAKR